MKQPEPTPSAEDIHNVFRDMQFRMRNYAMHQFDHIGPRTRIMLQHLDLFEEQAEPKLIGAGVDPEILRNPRHPQRVPLPPGPLVVYLTTGEKLKRMLVELPMLLYSESDELRTAALDSLEGMLSDETLAMTPRSREAMTKHRDALRSGNKAEWRPAAVAVNDALYDDIIIALHAVDQCLQCRPMIQDSLNFYVPRILHPTISSLESIALDVRNPERQQEQMADVIRRIVENSSDLASALADYHAKLGHLPLAPPYGMAEVVIQWVASHPACPVWDEVWSWRRDVPGPLASYHACTVFVLHPEWIPEGKLADLWVEMLGVLDGSEKKPEGDAGSEPWMLRRDIARHLTYHIEAHLPDNEGASIACFAWWLAERIATLFPDAPESAQFYRKEWIEPAADRSIHVWLSACPRLGLSFLRYMTCTLPSPWAESLLALVGLTLDRLDPDKQSEGTRRRFHDVLVSGLISCLPFSAQPQDAPTFALQLSLRPTVEKWAPHCVEPEREAMLQLANSSQRLGTTDGLCEALRKLDESSLADQVAIGLSLKAKAFTDSTLGQGVWNVLSDSAWRSRVFTKLETRVFALLAEAMMVLQVENGGKWLSHLPQFLAELCEQEEDVERLRHLFLYTVHACLASDTTAALRRLLRGSRREKFVPLAKEARERVEGAWSAYPPWVQGRLRGLLATLNATP